MSQATHASATRDSSTNEGKQAGSGFHAKLKGASLADLIQMVCLTGSRAVVRVTSGNRVGHLFFRGGALVHASTPSATGEPAAMEMLSWSWGTFEPAEREWTRDTIATSWQGLLMRAAQLEDERGAGSVVPLHAEEDVELEATPLDVADHTLRAEDFALYVRMSPDGKVVASHGSTQAFAGVVAFALRLAQLAGEQLGLEGFRAMECTLREGQCFVVLEDGGGIVVLQPRATADADSVRELLGL